VDGRVVANVNLVPGSSGGGLMTNMGQNAIDIGCLGSVPAELQIVSGNNATIIQSINAGGTGIVVNNQLPCSDWDSFVSLIKKRSMENNQVKIATVQSSIQEEIIREALNYEGIKVSLF
jgi:ABC-type nitrate/sulfonate/bicarbonate transport system substrate-binding protein